jgi:hypothetical protein
MNFYIYTLYINIINKVRVYILYYSFFFFYYNFDTK